MLMRVMNMKQTLAVTMITVTLALAGCVGTPAAAQAPEPVPAAISPEQAFVDGVRGMEPIPPTHVKDAEILKMGNALCKIIRTGNWAGFNATDPYAVKLVRLAKQTIC